MTNISGSLVCPIIPEDGTTSDPEMLVEPSNNPEDFKQHYDHGGSLQLHI
jgi:hypothetical protein